ncbi:MAG: zf-HC2 domain-containing protein [Ignavibacteriales bacterium]|nr:zf-HC2 domain-containing protein [Ignavibacteriales bacterium]
MSESKNIHWVEKEDLLEQFVLGRLNSAEVAQLEEHLQECDQCCRAVAKERELVAGIRLAGRESMKHRLAQRIEEQKAHSANWYRVAGVAAGIVLLVTVGVYNRWFTSSETHVEKQDRVDRTEKRAEPAPPVSPRRQIAEAGKSHADAARRAAEEEENKVPSLAAGATKSAGAKSGNIAEAQVDKLEDLKALEGGREAENRGKKDRFAAVTAVSTVAATWVQGTVILERDQNAPAPAEMAANAKDERADLRKGKEQNLLAGKAANVEAGEKVVQNFILTQKPLSDLPPSQRAQQQKTSFVQTLLQKHPSGTRITVFLDSLLTKKEFDQTRVQAIGEDSIILNLGNRLVGYKLPSGWTGQGVQQTRKQK